MVGHGISIRDFLVVGGQMTANSRHRPMSPPQASVDDVIPWWFRLTRGSKLVWVPLCSMISWPGLGASPSPSIGIGKKTGQAFESGALVPGLPVPLGTYPPVLEI